MRDHLPERERTNPGPLLIARVSALLLALTVVSCGEPAASDPEARDQELREQDRGRRGHAVGTLRIQVAASEGRTLPVQLWYPAVERARREAERGRPLLEIEPGAREHALLDQLLQAAPAAGASHVMHAADAPEPLHQKGRFPLIVFSHCSECVRFSSLSIAEHLASLGFIVAAPDHVRNTVYDLLEGTSVGLDLPGFLPQRLADMTAVLDTLLDPSSDQLPRALRGRSDPERVGALGHSFGGLTIGLLTELDPRVQAAAALAVPIAIPLGFEDQYPPGTRLADLTHMSKPFMFLAAAEDYALFNFGIDDNFQRYPAEAWHVTVRETGHYSFTDICGMPAPTAPGSCSEGPRQTDPNVTFMPLAIDRARTLAKQYVAAFFERTLLDRGPGPRAVQSGGDAVVEYKR